MALKSIEREVIGCRACPRLVEWRERVARDKIARFADQNYWGRPVPGFGDAEAGMLVLGLAPAAHGGNRTGRIFTGDRSGDFLYASVHRVGIANQPTSEARGDGLALRGAYVTAVNRCAPPANKPTPEERDRCAPYLARELALLDDVGVVVALGQFAYDAACRLFAVRPRPRFGHGVEVALPAGRTLLSSYHPSQQNTFTGTLTEPAFDAIFTRARRLVTVRAAGGT